MHLENKHIDEKFSDESDPIRDMSIGILNVHKNFKNTTQLWEWLYNVIPHLLNIKNISKIFSTEQDHAGGMGVIKRDIYVEICEYINKYLTVNHKPIGLESTLFKKFIEDKKNMTNKKLVRENIIEEGYGSGFSMNSFKGGMGGTTRGGFGGANNFGGQNSMYTYEIKALNHTLEQKPTVDANSQVEQIQIGSKIRGIPIRSNATPDKKYVTGIVREISQTNDGAIKYYLVLNQDNQLPVKIDPLTTKLVIFDPVEYYDDVSLTTDNMPSRRKEKIDALKKGKIVRESLVNEEEEEVGGRDKSNELIKTRKRKFKRTKSKPIHKSPRNVTSFLPKH